MNLHPIRHCVEAAKEWHKNGFDTYQQFICAGCGEQNTMEEANKFFIRGKCRCGVETNLLKDGCNYMAQAGPLDRRGPKSVAIDPDH